jgi:hypothetical protein
MTLQLGGNVELFVRIQSPHKSVFGPVAVLVSQS